MDSYFPEMRFFTEFERFDRYVERLSREERKIDYISICSPNYLHDAHVRFALRNGADAICEKPLVLNPHNVDALAALEKQTGQKVNTILQLRLHPVIKALREKMQADTSGRIHDVDLTYITPRGRWYYVSWKGDEGKSGGIATNIGVHLFDMLSFVFGPLRRNVVHHRAVDCACGYLEFQNARARWFLSINGRDIPDHIEQRNKAFRSITVDGEAVEFSGRIYGSPHHQLQGDPGRTRVPAVRRAQRDRDGVADPYPADRSEQGRAASVLEQGAQRFGALPGWLADLKHRRGRRSPPTSRQCNSRWKCRGPSR